MAERRYKLAVLRFPGNNAEHPASSGWIIAQQPRWAADPRISSVVPLRKSDTPITMVRNLLVKAALDQGCDYILMIDADMEPDVEPDGKPFWDTSWAFMMERRAREECYRASLDTFWEHTIEDETLRPATDQQLAEHKDRVIFEEFPPATIAAPYCGPPPHERVYVMRWKHDESNTVDVRPFELTMFDRDHASMFAGIWEVGALATGLILYDARVFKRLPTPWFAYEWTDKYALCKSITEDIYQTRNASLLGMPQLCNWDAWAGHIKSKTVRKPRALPVHAVPDAMADAIRKGIRGDCKIIVLPSESDATERPTSVASPTTTYKA